MPARYFMHSIESQLILIYQRGENDDDNKDSISSAF